MTENCQNCLGKACINACHFGAIEAGRHRSHIDPSKCKECGKCAEACPYNAIAHLQRPCKFSCPVDAISYDEYGISVIDEEKCIRCGKCIHSCPFGAIGSKTWIVDVINAINAGKTRIRNAGSGYGGTVRTGHHHGQLAESHERTGLHRIR